MSLTIPINGLQYSLDDNVYEDIPVTPLTMDIELEQVTANSYRTVNPKITLNNDFLGIIAKVSCSWHEMTRTEYQFLANYFYANRFIYLRFFNPNGNGSFIRAQFKCGNLIFSVSKLENGIPQEYLNLKQNYTLRESQI